MKLGESMLDKLREWMGGAKFLKRNDENCLTRK